MGSSFESLIGLSVEKDSEAASERFKNGHLDNEQCPSWAQKKQRQGAGEWPPLSVPTAHVTEGQTAAHRAVRTCPESRSRWWHGENLSPETSSVKATDSMETGNVPALPGAPPAPPLTARGQTAAEQLLPS